MNRKNCHTPNGYCWRYHVNFNLKFILDQSQNGLSDSRRLPSMEKTRYFYFNIICVAYQELNVSACFEFTFFSFEWRNRVTHHYTEACFTDTWTWPNTWLMPVPILGSKITTDWFLSTILSRIESFSRDYLFQPITKICARFIFGARTQISSKISIWTRTEKATKCNHRVTRNLFVITLNEFSNEQIISI